MGKSSFFIRLAHWPDDERLLKQVRERVFIQEQQVPKDLEWDGEDHQALQLLALDAEQNPIGTARLLGSGQIGRMAVLEAWRNQGIGSALLKRLLTEAEQGDYPELFLNAQLTALPFYQRQGFQAEGDVFDEAGIPHQRMTRQPQKTESSPGFMEANLGLTQTTYYLHSAEEYRDLATRMVAQATRTLSLISGDLEPLVYDQAPFISAVKQLALKSQVAHIRILIQDNSLLRRQGHRLIDLAQRLTSTIEVRKPDREYREFAQSFLLVDDCGYLHRQQADRYTTTACFHDRLQTAQLEETFSEIWERGEPDMELVRLHL
ncbi:MAG: GNAT family N-acetyltransferase [Pseudomonadota bacterium]